MIITPSPPDRPLVLAFDLIRRYAAAHGWTPIGWRSFGVGSWTVVVNGTADSVGGLPPYHALVVHNDTLAALMFTPFDGVGWNCHHDVEDRFIHDMEAALEAKGLVSRETFSEGSEKGSQR